MIQPLNIPTAEMLPEDETAVESFRFWRHERDLAALLVYAKKTGPSIVEYLLSPVQYKLAMSHAWTEGKIL